MTYQPATDYFGNDSFTYTINDGHEGTATAIVNVTVNDVPENPPPVNTLVAFVGGLYRDVLRRAADGPGSLFWTGFLERGVGRLAVAAGIWESAEHRGLQVDQYYANFLDRPADPASRADWVRAFLEGRGETRVARDFLTSLEYLGSHAGPQAFVMGLYTDVLGRAPDPIGQAFWERQLQLNPDRETAGLAAQAFLTSPEAHGRLVDAYYADYLGRAADVLSRGQWVDRLGSGLDSATSVAEAILGSDEYLTRVIR